MQLLTYEFAEHCAVDELTDCLQRSTFAIAHSQKHLSDVDECEAVGYANLLVDHCGYLQIAAVTVGNREGSRAHCS
jgi:hypothetical protein